MTLESAFDRGGDYSAHRDRCCSPARKVLTERCFQPLLEGDYLRHPFKSHRIIKFCQLAVGDMVLDFREHQGDQHKNDVKPATNRDSVSHQSSAYRLQHGTMEGGKLSSAREDIAPDTVPLAQATEDCKLVFSTCEAKGLIP